MSKVKVWTGTIWAPDTFSSTPSVPTNAAVTAGDTTATLTWGPPDNLGGGVLTGYRVGRDGTDSTGFGAFSTVVSAATTSFTFAQLVNGTTYNVYVEAITNLVDPGDRVTLSVVPTGTGGGGLTGVYRQLGIYNGSIPTPDQSAFTSFQTELLGGSTLLLGENFQNASWSAIESGGGQYPDWKTWLALGGGRQAILTVGLYPHFGPDQGTVNAWATKAGTDTQVSTALAAGAAGNYDAHWITFANNLTNGLENSIIRLGWEFNGNFYGWRAGPNPTAWVTYFQKIADIIHARKPNAVICWNFLGNDLTKDNLKLGNGTNSGFVLNDVYPGASYVDVIGADVYDQHGNKTKANGWSQVTGPALSQWAQYASTKGKRLAIPEWGVTTDNTVDEDNDTYINNMWSFIEANQVMFHVYFNASASDGDHKLTSSRTVTDGVTTNGSPTVTSATAAFTTSDVFRPIAGTGIPANSYIGVRNSATSIGLSSSSTANVPVNATATATGVSVGIGFPVAKAAFAAKTWRLTKV